MRAGKREVKKEMLIMGGYDRELYQADQVCTCALTPTLVAFIIMQAESTVMFCWDRLYRRWS